MKPVRLATLALALSLAAAFAAPALAQDNAENIVVTGSRISKRLGDAYPIPQIGVRRRADFLIRSLTVACDTRELGAREDELTKTLRSMLAAAGRDKSIVLSRFVALDSDADRYGDGDKTAGTIVVPFTDADITGRFDSGYQGRTDTSYVSLLIKTPVSDSDTLASAVGRIEKFVKSVDHVGRSTVDLGDDDVLSVVNPAQYRGPIFEAMSEDAKARIAALGTGYAARFEGIENKVSWYRSDVLDVTLFIPHKLAIVPAGSAAASSP
jgi:hypothetical protein